MPCVSHPANMYGPDRVNPTDHGRIYLPPKYIDHGILGIRSARRVDLSLPVRHARVLCFSWHKPSS